MAEPTSEIDKPIKDLESRFKQNLREITKIVIKKGKKPINAPTSAVTSLDTSADKTKGYSAELNLESSVRFLGESEWAFSAHSFSVIKNGPPGPSDPYAIRDNDIFLSLRPNGRIHLNVDVEREPEAQNFEEPSGSPLSQLMKLNEKVIITATSFSDLGENTRIFLDSFVGSALKEFQNLK